MYHETLWQAVQAALATIPARHAVDVDACSAAQPMAYETSQTLRLPLDADAGLTRGRRAFLIVNLYRMPSGRYEMGAYAA